MTLEQALIAALTAVVSALAYLYNQIRLRSEKCERWRDEKEPIIQKLEREVGALSAIASMVNGCKTQGCAFANNTTFSLTVKRTKPEDKP